VIKRLFYFVHNLGSVKFHIVYECFIGKMIKIMYCFIGFVNTYHRGLNIFLV